MPDRTSSTPSAPRLYHTASSYYSSIARLALVEAGVAFSSVPLDIHRRMAQLEPDYARLNPNMTVPTLVLDGSGRAFASSEPSSGGVGGARPPDREGRTLSESRDIVLFAFGDRGDDDATRRWLDEHYAFPIDELTFSWLLRWNRLARRFVPKSLAASEARLRALAAAHPDLSERYLRRAEVFAGRSRAFDPTAVASLWEERRRAALGLLDTLEGALEDRRSVLVPPKYGPADVVWTVFLARMRFIRLGDEIARRPALARYAESMFARPSFRAADVWDRIKVLGLLKQIL